MKSPLAVVRFVFISIIIGGGVYVLIQYWIADDESISIGIPFAYIGIVGLGLFIASVVFLFIYIKRLHHIWKLLVATFLITSIIPGWHIYVSYRNRPVAIPIAKELPVSLEEYTKIQKLVIEDYWLYDTDSNHINIIQDKILHVKIDTIIFNQNKDKFFAILIAFARDGNESKYCAEYRVGILQIDQYRLIDPRNVWSTCFTSIGELKAKVRQYYYKRYSINGSSDKMEIWDDTYIWSFPGSRQKYRDRNK